MKSIEGDKLRWAFGNADFLRFRAGRCPRAGNSPPPGGFRLRVAPAQGRVALSGPLSAGRGGKIEGFWEEETRGRWGATTHLSLDRQRKTRIDQRPRGLDKLRPGHRRNCRSSGMNENTHKALMIEVERAVRPVRAGERRKLQMRKNCWPI